MNSTAKKFCQPQTLPIKLFHLGSCLVGK